VHYKLSGHHVLVAQSKGAEAVGDPAEPFTCRVGVARLRIGRANDLREEDLEVHSLLEQRHA
jgi:hypothetical protein